VKILLTVIRASLCLLALLALPSVLAQSTSQTQGISLLGLYPTPLTKADADPNRARAWKITPDDIYEISGFSLRFLKVGASLRISITRADLGIGRSEDGAVWAIVIPRAGDRMVSPASRKPEAIDHVWLRFHPKIIDELFPRKTVLHKGDTTLLPRMEQIANAKIHGSWHAARRAMIPPPNQLTVDIDTDLGIRRFFTVDLDLKVANYVPAFEKQAVPVSRAITRQKVEASFDELWSAFDREYPMFVLRPNVDWPRLRDKYRPQALASKTAREFACVCASMLAHLRDLHIWITVNGEQVPAFDRPRRSNANPSACRCIIDEIAEAGGRMEWGKTRDGIGYIAIYSWDDEAIPDLFDGILEKLRSTSALVIDVRLNGGGSEPLAQKVAARFTGKEVIYAYSQYRSGPKHEDLGQKYSRKITPRGPWRYEQPVIVLIGQKCMSSNESFISMMAQCPQVTTMGDRTCGSSGNPRILQLPVGVTVSLPRWIDCLPDGQPLDERGVEPDVYFETKPEAFAGDRDDLLTAALKQLREATRR